MLQGKFPPTLDISLCPVRGAVWAHPQSIKRRRRIDICDPRNSFPGCEIADLQSGLVALPHTRARADPSPSDGAGARVSAIVPLRTAGSPEWNNCRRGLGNSLFRSDGPAHPRLPKDAFREVQCGSRKAHSWTLNPQPDPRGRSLRDDSRNSLKPGKTR